MVKLSHVSILSVFLLATLAAPSGAMAAPNGLPHDQHPRDLDDKNDLLVRDFGPRRTGLAASAAGGALFRGPFNSGRTRRDLDEGTEASPLSGREIYKPNHPMFGNFQLYPAGIKHRVSRRGLSSSGNQESNEQIQNVRDLDDDTAEVDARLGYISGLGVGTIIAHPQQVKQIIKGATKRDVDVEESATMERAMTDSDAPFEDRAFD